MARQFAVVTGASAGIGYELARCCAAEGFDLLIAADEPRIHDVARELRQHGVNVTAIETDLVTDVGVDELYEAMQDRQVDLLLANAGRGLGGAFLDQDFGDVTDVVATNMTGTLYLMHRADFFERADMLDTRIARQQKDDPAEVARLGFDAMMRGEGDIVPGWMNKLRSAIALVTPWSILAEQHRTVAEPGSARRAG